MSRLHVEILMEAKKSVASGRESFVCTAVVCTVVKWCLVDKSGPLATSMLRAKRDILDDIKDSLAPYGVLEQWLEKTHPEVRVDSLKNYCEHMREYRLAWIDYLMEYWRDKP